MKKLLNRIPAGRGVDLIHLIVGNWIDFVDTVKTEKGWFKILPTYPTLGFLLINLETALDMMTKTSNPEELTPTQKKFLNPIKYSKKPQGPKPDIATWEDIIDD